MRLKIVVVFATIAILSTPSARAEIFLEPFAKVDNPIGLVWDGSRPIVSIRNETDQGISRLAVIERDGSVKSVFPHFVGGHEVYFAMSHGLAGFTKGYIYMVSFDAILEIDPAVSRVRNFSIPYPFDPVIFLAFDTVGTWGNKLLATTEDGSVWKIDGLGRAERIIVLGQHTWFEGIAVAPLDYGKIGGYLVLSSKEQEKVIAISPEKPHKVIDVASFPGEQPEHVFFIPPAKDLLLAMNEEDQIVRISAEQLRPYSGSMFLITEGENNRTGSIYAITPSSDGFKVEKLFSKRNPHFEGYAFIAPRNDLSALLASSLPYLVVGISVIVVIVAIIGSKRKFGRVG